MPLTEQQKEKLLKKSGAQWYVDLVKELKQKPGEKNAKILQN